MLVAITIKSGSETLGAVGRLGALAISSINPIFRRAKFTIGPASVIGLSLMSSSRNLSKFLSKPSGSSTVIRSSSVIWLLDRFNFSNLL